MDFVSFISKISEPPYVMQCALSIVKTPVMFIDNSSAVRWKKLKIAEVHDVAR